MSNNATFASNVTDKVATAKKLAGWSLRTFISRDKDTMLTLLKTEIIPKLECCCQLWNPYISKETQDIECVQKSFTKKIDGMYNLNYWERLRTLKLYSLERRRERYLIIYVWKIIRGIVPNIEGDNKIVPYDGGRLGTLCRIPGLNSSAMRRIKTYKDNSFFVKGPKLFNCMPNYIRDCLDNLDKLKCLLDNFILKIPDEPNYVYMRPAQTNSLLHQVQLWQRNTR